MRRGKLRGREGEKRGRKEGRRGREGEKAEQRVQQEEQKEHEACREEGSGEQKFLLILFPFLQVAVHMYRRTETNSKTKMAITPPTTPAMM